VLDALARLSARRPRAVLSGAAVVTVVALVVGASAIDRLYPFSAADPESDSVRATELVFDQIGIDPDAGIVALIDLPGSFRSPGSQERVDDVARRIFLERGVGLVSSYYTSGDRSMISTDGTKAFVVGFFETPSDREQQLAAERLHDEFADDPGVRFGGEAPGNVDVKETVASDIALAELIAFPLLLLVSFWFFRGLVAALLPIAVGALAVACAIAGLRIANELTEISVFALNLVLGLALALSVDYGLLIVTRYREELARLGPGPEAIRATVTSAGRTVAFSSIAIACAMASLLVFPQRFLYSMGLGGIIVGLAAGSAALLVLPALLALLGRRVNSWAPARLQRVAAEQARPESRGAWYRIARLVSSRPVPIAIGASALLIALGLPFLSARYTAVDTSALPPGAESREVRETLDTQFPANLTLPLFVVLDRVTDAQARAVAARIRDLEGAARVDPPSSVGRAELIRVSPAEGPRAAGSEELVREIRAIDAPGPVLVGGRAADYVDQKASIADHLPLALGLLILTTLTILFVMTRSVVLPVKAVLMNALTLCAALGVLVFVFQDGRLEGLFGYDSLGALDLAQPLVLVAVGFGISTDYGVFLLTRIKEAHDAGAPNSEAVALGLERTGRVVTMAAVLICIGIGAFATSQIVFIKELGIGVAVAVLLDATIVRALLVPSLMTLLGRWNWWPGYSASGPSSAASRSTSRSTSSAAAEISPATSPSDSEKRDST
jgi:RND superfamily putative drug exporter